ncbi:ankyrin repeat-containing protein [Anaeramoeba ignava]|uniref:Ankyrin repeat-containing protein n=1 Tax=Anaeramoeba ignava TaxID=1746090 RepID=A0A9Q0LBV7_ANAIG|nr:ankyrin repeat-containing protein [Anaeramoeba ignava]
MSYFSKRNQFPLHQACQKSNYKEVSNLIESGKNVNQLDTKSPLHYACENKSFKIIKLLINSKSNLNQKNGETPLIVACKSHADFKVIELLIKNGASINIATSQNVLHFACENNQSLNVIELLLNSGINPNSKNQQIPLHLACKKRNEPEIISLLIKSGSEVNSTDNQTPLHIACQSRVEKKVIELLIENGADVDCFDNFTPLFYACKYSLNTDSIRYILETYKVFSVNIFDERTPLHYACLSKEEELIELLLFFGAITDKKDQKKPQDYLDNTNIGSEVFNVYSGIMNDMEKLFERKECTDFEIFCQNGKIEVHKQVLIARYGEDVENLAKNLQSFTVEEVKEFMRLIYSSFLSQKSISTIQKISSQLGFFWKDKASIAGLVRDLSKFWEDEKSKDFTISLENEKFVRVHKFILLARSELFRGMFVSVIDDSNSVPDYSGRSYETIKELIRYLYFNEIQFDCPDFVLEELKEAQDFYQLNDYFLYELKKANKKRKI